MRIAGLVTAVLMLALSACASAKGKQDVDADTGGASIGQAQGTHGDGRRNVFERMFGQDKAPNAGPCPLLGVLYDASRVVVFKGGEERYANVAWTGEMRGVRGLCRYTGTKPIELSLEIEMAFGRGPAAEADHRTYRYWVAVTRTNTAPISKQYFDLDVAFPKAADRLAGAESIAKIVIPRANETISGTNFEVLVGFDLTPEQLAFNRAGKRFRVDVGGKQN
jgi:hypothetical protein